MIITQALNNAIEQLTGFSIDNSNLNFQSNNDPAYKLMIKIRALRNQVELLLKDCEKLNEATL